MTPQTLRTLRKLHHYFGVVLAPAILFFAISGGLQTFRLQQASGWSGSPPSSPTASTATTTPARTTPTRT